jgi:hypothetical protein
MPGSKSLAPRKKTQPEIFPVPQKPASAIRQCPGLTVDPETGVCFTDSLQRVYNLEREKTLRPKEAAADARLCGMPVAEVRTKVRRGELYPVLRRNRRVVLIFDCALTDWRARQLGADRRRGPKHLFTARALVSA